MEKSTVFVASDRDATGCLVKELEELGFTADRVAPSGVFITVGGPDVLQLNLLLRTAHRVLLLLGEFTAEGPEELYAGVRTLPWEQIIPPDGYLCVYSNVENPAVKDGRYANLKCKDAIVDRMAEATGNRPDSGPERNQTVVYLYWKGRRASVYIDTSGRSLSRRGYRKLPLTAPMQETLAAAVILTTAWNPQTAFVNPMCGSGTLAIEAALLSLNRAPGLLRDNFGFMHVRGYDPDLWQALKERSSAGERGFPGGRIIASDIDPAAVDAARANAAAAGVEAHIEFHVCDFSLTPVPEGPGVVVLNPEYGVRMGEIPKLAPLYGRIGDFFKRRCQGYTGYVFSCNLKLLGSVGLRTSRRVPFHSGGMDCRLHEYRLYEGTGSKTESPPDS
jgi:23S rRNA G2445 N2-methylase RlmL